MPTATAERPLLRVALFGIGDRYQRMFDLLLRHARNNRYRFERTVDVGAGQFEIALVDVMSENGAKLARSLQQALPAQAVLTVGRRVANVDRRADDIVADRFVAHTMFVLGRTAERLVGGASAAPWSSAAAAPPAGDRDRDEATGNDDDVADGARGTGSAGAEFASGTGVGSHTDATPAASSVGESYAASWPQRSSFTEPSRPAPLPAPAGPVDAAMLVSDFGTLRRPRVLVVDDSATVRSQVAAALERMEIDAEFAEHAKQALSMVTTRRYEMVFADVVMPDMDGYRMTREIRRNRALKGLPVVMLTSKSSPFDRARGALAGCNSYLVKPVTMQALRETVYKQLRKAQARGAS